MKRKILNSFVIIGLSVAMLFSLNTCKDPDTPTYECTPDITVPFPQDALDRFYFKTGTWWVYEEINNPGMEDSVWVFDHRLNTNPPDEKIYGRIKTWKCYDIYNIWTNSSRFSEVRWFLQIYGPFDGFNYAKELFEITEQPLGNQDINRAMLYGNNYDGYTNFGNKIAVLYSTTINGITYHDVLHFEKIQGQFDYLQEAWYVKNIGLVKFKRTDGSEWEVRRYGIIQ